MKKILLFMLMALPFVFTSCSDDDDKEVNTTNLEGTSWIAYKNDVHHEITLKFYKNTFEMKMTDGGDVVSISGTYEYEYLDVWMEYDGEIDKITIADGNKFVIDLGDGDKATFVLL